MQAMSLCGCIYNPLLLLLVWCSGQTSTLTTSTRGKTIIEYIMSMILYPYIHTVMSIFIADCICSHKYMSLAQEILTPIILYCITYVCMYVYIRFKTFFYVVRHLDSIASCLPTGLHLGFFRSWPSLFLPSSFSSVFLVLSFVLASTSMQF